MSYARPLEEINRLVTAVLAFLVLVLQGICITGVFVWGFGLVFDNVGGYYFGIEPKEINTATPTVLVGGMLAFQAVLTMFMASDALFKYSRSEATREMAELGEV
ncbi:hypothetical protein VE03_09752 [Pseudogymnoascus sp. 23342-1-I1]|nr:hypothetical protein VE03_09752 [Pseudogymnoascus sp. 23342-1-I1]